MAASRTPGTSGITVAVTTDTVTARSAETYQWRAEASWFFAGTLVGLGLLVGFFTLFAAPVALAGVLLALGLARKHRPGAWMMPTGMASATAVLYGLSVGGAAIYALVFVIAVIALLLFLVLARRARQRS
jgi:hypothetical protein